MRNPGKGTTVDQPTGHQRGYSSATTNGLYAINSSNKDILRKKWKRAKAVYGSALHFPLSFGLKFF